MSTVIVVPCFNEADRLPVEAVCSYFSDNPKLRLVLVNDGSTDGTLMTLKRVELALPDQVTVLDLQRNSGKAEAVRLGMLDALEQSPQYVGFWDADLATPLEAIAEFIHVMDQNDMIDIVMGARVRLMGRTIERQALRHYAGRVFATAVSHVLRLPVYDTQCGAKLFRAGNGLSEMLRSPFLSRWIFDVEILARMGEQYADTEAPLEQRLYELPLMEWRDVAGSHLRLKDFARAAVELLRIARRHPAQNRQHGQTIPGSSVPIRPSRAA